MYETIVKSKVYSMYTRSVLALSVIIIGIMSGFDFKTALANTLIIILFTLYGASVLFLAPMQPGPNHWIPPRLRTAFCAIALNGIRIHIRIFYHFLWWGRLLCWLGMSYLVFTGASVTQLLCSTFLILMAETTLSVLLLQLFRNKQYYEEDREEILDQINPWE